jgi:hypothetical protein
VATTLSSCAFAAMWMLCIAPTPLAPHSEGYCAKRPDASASVAPATWRYSPQSAAPKRQPAWPLSTFFNFETAN